MAAVDRTISHIAIQINDGPEINRLATDDGRSIRPDEKGTIIVRERQGRLSQLCARRR